MLQRWAGPIVVVLSLGGVLAVLGLSLNLKGRNSADGGSNKPGTAQAGQPSKSTSTPVPMVRPPAGFREYPIGDEVEKNGMLIKAVWLPPVQMDGMEVPTSSELIHLEADVHATEGNPNGFAKDEFIPYMIVSYTITPANGKGRNESVRAVKGPMGPMVARDGLHYGATIERPAPGHYKLTYAFEPPWKGGLGRHVDPATGVAPWWKPFEVSFDWDFQPEG